MTAISRHRSVALVIPRVVQLSLLSFQPPQKRSPTPVPLAPAGTGPLSVPVAWSLLGAACRGSHRPSSPAPSLSVARVPCIVWTERHSLCSRATSLTAGRQAGFLPVAEGTWAGSSFSLLCRSECPRTTECASVGLGHMPGSGAAGPLVTPCVTF